MRTIFALMVGLMMVAGLATAYEVTLGSDPLIVVAETKATAVSEFAKRTNGMTVTVGDIRSVHGRAYVATTAGATSMVTLTNIVGAITNVAATIVVQSETEVPDPDVRGTYLKTASGTWTNGAYAIWLIGTTNVVGDIAEAGSETPEIVYFQGVSLGAMEAVDATGSIDVAAVDEITEVTETVFAPIATGDRIVDGSVTWVIVPQTRQALHLKAASGDAVLTDARGNKILVETLPGYRGAIYGTSTNAAVVNVFWY